VVVASTDEHGATVVEKRIREQLERSERLRARFVFNLSSVALKLPATDSREPIEKLVQEVAANITEMTMSALRRGQAPAN
jgi:hypothetical protein